MSHVSCLLMPIGRGGMGPTPAEAAPQQSIEASHVEYEADGDSTTTEAKQQQQKQRARAIITRPAQTDNTKKLHREEAQGHRGGCSSADLSCVLRLPFRRFCAASASHNTQQGPSPTIQVATCLVNHVISAAFSDDIGSSEEGGDCHSLFFSPASL